ncbi:HAD-IA family hydrolase [Streptomyces sp. NPDC005438]|uniref:HAD-IA family hydrolase n=1 Tax=Streptomyces sp. NPDC005438 TaxID=3156880 RepID=UPI0033B5E29A
MVTFDAVLCDVDNVIRTYDQSALNELEREVGLEPGATARIAFSGGQDLPLLLGQITPEQWADNIARELADVLPAPDARRLAGALITSPFSTDDQVVELLRRVRELMPLVLVSNASVSLEEDLESLGLADLAHSVVNSARVGVVKPEEKIYRIASERAGVAVERCLFVDDRRENTDAAQALGMTAVCFRGVDDLRAALEPLWAESTRN